MIVIVFIFLTTIGSGRDSSKLQNKDAGVPPLPATAKKIGAPLKSTTSGSSGEQSYDDEAEGENEATQNMDPTDAKRMRRYSSESFCWQKDFLDSSLLIMWKSNGIYKLLLVRLS